MSGAPSATGLLLAMAVRRGLTLTHHAPGAGVVVRLPEGATFLDGVLATLLVARSAEVLDVVAAEAARTLDAELAALGGGDEAPA